MEKGVKKVREKIKQRKKQKYVQSRQQTGNDSQMLLLQEEEKHGYYPSIFEQTSSKKRKSSFYSAFFLKGILSVALFAAVAWISESNLNYVSKPKEWVQVSLTEEFPFAKLHQWYQTTFGSPHAFIPTEIDYSTKNNELALPVSGSVVETFQNNGTGIMILPEDTVTVSSIQGGIVIFAGNDAETGKTVVVQHPDGSKSTYGYLSSINVHLYQYVEADKPVGAFHPTEESKTVYFSIEKDRKHIDPIQVIPVGDLP